MRRIEKHVALGNGFFNLNEILTVGNDRFMKLKIFFHYILISPFKKKIFRYLENEARNCKLFLLNHFVLLITKALKYIVFVEKSRADKKISPCRLDWLIFV